MSTENYHSIDDSENPFSNPFAEGDSTLTTSLAVPPSPDPDLLANSIASVSIEDPVGAGFGGPFRGGYDEQTEFSDVSIDTPKAERYSDVDDGPLGGEAGSISGPAETTSGARTGREEDEESVSTRASQVFQVPEKGVRPTFEITVGEPQKVGDPLTAHMLYKVRTKTNSPAFRTREFTVQRRYRDFLWLYNQLTAGNPGVIVPPVPEKHAIGRFQDSFIESRRQALERCLRKIVAHPMLYGDPALKLFLESDMFSVDVKQNPLPPSSTLDSPRPAGGLLSTFGQTISTFSKFIEVDDWFEKRRIQLDVLEGQLKALLKSVEAVVKQRKDVGTASFDFGDSMLSLASAELNKPLANHLAVLGNLQKKIRDIHEKQAQQDVLTLENTVDEYVRIISSIKIAFQTRARTHQAYTQADNDLQKKRAALAKLRAGRSTRPDKAHVLQQEIVEGEHRVAACKREFEDISKLIKQELDRFDHEKVEDFKVGVEGFLESMVGYQKEIIALWESYFAELDGPAGSGAVPESETSSLVAS